MLALAWTAIVHVPRTLRKSAILVTNSGALAIGTLAAAGLGFVYWWLAARMFPPEVIGNAFALLSVISLVALLGEAGVGTLLIGEIVRHPGREAGLAGAAACIAATLALGLGLLFVFAEPLLSSARPIGDWFEACLFVFGCSLTAFSFVLEQALVGSLRSGARMVRQMLFSTFKLMLIAAAATAGFHSNAAILLTWVAGLLVSWIGLDLLTRGGARRLLAVPDFGLLHTLRGKVLGHYALDVSVQAPAIIMPYLVLVLLSPTINAAFASLWMLVSMAALIPAAMATVLFPVVRANSKQFAHDMLLSLAVSLLFSLVCAVVVFAYSRQLLALFNPAYPEIAGSSLRLLGFSLLGSTLKFHGCTLARLSDKMRKASVWFALGGLLELGFAVAGAKLDGLQGLVVGWTLAVSIEGTCAALVLALATNASPAREGLAPSQENSDHGAEAPSANLVACGHHRNRARRRAF
jgi:O-antigen/teichoic acid export membrane protein